MTRFTKPQRWVKDKANRSKESGKIGKERRRDHIVQGEVISLNHVFLVTNGDDDIRMVYNGTSSGIDDYLWDLQFA